MKVTRIDPRDRAPLTSHFYKGSVARQQLIAESESAQFRLSIIAFAKGAENKVHQHAMRCDGALASAEAIPATMV